MYSVMCFFVHISFVTNMNFCLIKVYCRDLGFPCAYNKSAWGALPTTKAFYDYLFSINNKEEWGMVVYENDWLNFWTESMLITTNNTEMGRNNMLWMGQAAELYGVSINTCMSYPRHLLSTVLSPSFTSTRSTTDYWPGKENWKIGTLSIFVSAIDLTPSKNTWWSSNVKQINGIGGRCEPDGCQEPYNRLQSAVVALSNGPNYSSDRVGYENVSLIMMCCNSNGLLLRPDVSATAMDVNILGKANISSPTNNILVNGELYSSMSYINNEYMYYYVFAANISNMYPLSINELSFYSIKPF